MPDRNPTVLFMCFFSTRLHLPPPIFQRDEDAGIEPMTVATLALADTRLDLINYKYVRILSLLCSLVLKVGNTPIFPFLTVSPFPPPPPKKEYSS